MNTVVKDLEETAKMLQEALVSIPANIFNKIPFEGSWTAGQVANHIQKSTSSLTQVLNGNTKAVSRPPDEKCRNINEAFLDFSTKMKSPEFIIPDNREFDKLATIETLEGILNRIVEAGKTLDLSFECLDFSPPGMGNLTRLEWLCFVNAHTLRHIHQLNKIRKALTSNNGT